MYPFCKISFEFVDIMGLFICFVLSTFQVLMNKCTDDEPDPYITLDESFWPPYIELLLRCGIALRHPQACQRIRLVPFHL